MANTTRMGLPKPVLTDAPNGPSQIGALADMLDGLVGAPSYTVATLPTSGNYAGRLAWTTDTNTLYRHSGSAWLPVTQSSPKWVRATKLSTQTLSNDTYTAVTWPNEDFDNDTMHSTVTNNSRITCVTAGTYWVAATVSYAQNGSGSRKFYINKNSTQVAQATCLPVSASSTTLHTSFLIALSASDYLEVYAIQSSGGNLDITGDVGENSFEAFRVGTS